jgi:Peptidase propeptide and YPEB domain
MPNPTRFVLACAAACALAAGAAWAAPGTEPQAQPQAQKPSPVGVTAKARDGGSVPLGPVKDPPRWTSRSDYSSAADWFLKGDNIVPHGTNPLYFPIVPGHKHIHERPDHPDGHYRKETVVLDETEDFDLPGIGKFKTAVVQEEEYMDGVLTQRAQNWFAVDKTTDSVYAFGEVSWEIDEEGHPIFEGSWRAGEPDGEGHIAGPGLLMPSTFTIGSRYLFDDHQSIALGGSENVQSGIEITVPSGTFKDCVRVREQSLSDIKDITDKIWCPGVGLAYDTSDGNLIASNALPASNPASDVSSIGTFRNRPLSYNPPVAKVSGEQATKIALGVFEGKPTKLSIERKKGKNVYVVEVTTKDREEKDVFVDIESGQVVGTD